MERVDYIRMSNDNNIGNLLNTLKNIETEIIGNVVDNEKMFFKTILKKFINLKIALDIKSRKHDELMSGWNECVVEIEDYDSTTKICNIITANDDVLEVHYYSNFKTPYTFRGEKIKSDLDVSKYYYIINYYLDMDSNIDSDEKEVILNTFKTNYMLSLLEDYDLLPLES